MLNKSTKESCLQFQVIDVVLFFTIWPVTTCFLCFINFDMPPPTFELSLSNDIIGGPLNIGLKLDNTLLIHQLSCCLFELDMIIIAL